MTYHRTTHLDAQEIIEQGADPLRSRIGAYGQGFYTTTVPDPSWGPAEVMLAIRMQNPLIGPMHEIEEFVDALALRIEPRFRRLTPELAVLIRLELLHLGYDGVVVHDGGGDGIDYVIALLAESVKVVLQP